MRKKVLTGAATITHGLKEYGGGISMEAGILRIQKESRNKGFQEGVDYAFRHLSLWERIFGYQKNHR